MAAGDQANGRSSARAGSYLAVPNWRRHLHYSDRRAKWIKSYVAGDDDGRRGLDDDVLTGLPITTRLVFELMLKLAARFDNFIPYDVRRIGGWLAIRPQEVAKAVAALVEEGYLDLVTDVKVGGDGSLQLPLAAATTPSRSLHNGVNTPASTSSDPPPTLRHDPRQPDGATAQPSDTARNPASGTLGLTRAGARAAEQEQDQEKAPSSSNGTELRRGPALPEDEDPEILRRIIGLACRGDARSAAIVRNTAHGLPEHVLAQALESLLGRRPRPANPGGYIVSALRAIAADNGLIIARIDREPDL